MAESQINQPVFDEIVARQELTGLEAEEFKSEFRDLVNAYHEANGAQGLCFTVKYSAASMWVKYAMNEYQSRISLVGSPLEVQDTA